MESCENVFHIYSFVFCAAGKVVATTHILACIKYDPNLLVQYWISVHR